MIACCKHGDSKAGEGSGVGSMVKQELLQHRKQVGLKLVNTSHSQLGGEGGASA